MNEADIPANIAAVRETLAAACARSGRSPDEVTLVAVSKTVPPALVLAAAAAGIQHFGENRVEEAEGKIPALQTAAPHLHWHMIGHIQSRKARRVPGLFHLVHSVDSLRLAERLAESAQEQGQVLDVLLEVNISGEASKYGLQAAGWQADRAVRESLWQEVRGILALPALRVRGLMTMAPYDAEMEHARPVFAGLAALRRALQADLGQPLPELSMGMTDDYPVAVEEGATLIRVGRAIFGER